MAENPDKNPFVGPRPLSSKNPIFGRDREISEIYNLLGAARIVLLYSPSGAGKSSLVAAGLMPRLEQEFDVWGPARVRAEPQPGVTCNNRYVWSAAADFEPPEKEGGRPLKTLAPLTFKEFVATRPRKPDAQPFTLLIFDQFEEILRVDPVNIDSKKAFFRQLGEVLLDPHVWALFVLREDYLAPLDPYAPLLPTRFKNRYRIDLLLKEKAEEAILKVARTGGREFDPIVVKALVDDLAMVQVQQPDGSFASEPGQYVEPLHLQLAGEQLWKAGGSAQQGVAADVNDALGAYYDDVVAAAAGKDDQQQRVIRDWIREQLITAGGIRSQVMRGKGSSAGLSNTIIDDMVERHLLRQEPRGGTMWYELAHDRLLLPVRDSNQAWFDKHLSSFQRTAMVWDHEGRSKDGLLLLGDDLVQAREEAAKLLAPTAAEEDFLAASERRQAEVDRERRQIELEKQQAELERQRQQAELERERQQAEKERQQQVRNRRVRNVAIVAMLIAIAACAVALVELKKAERSAADARSQAAAAECARVQADTSAAEEKLSAEKALKEEKTAQDATKSAEQAAREATAVALSAQAQREVPLQSRRALQLAILAYRTAPVADAVSALHAAMLGHRVEQILTLGKPVAAVSFRGPTVAAFALDGTFRAWDAASGKLLGTTLDPPVTSASTAAFSVDGALLAAGDPNGTVQVWDVASGSLRYRVTTSQQRISALTFSAGNQYLATGSVNKSIRLWNGLTGQDTGKVLSNLESGVSGMAFGAADTLFYGTDGYGDMTTAAVGAWTFQTGRRTVVKSARYYVGAIASPPGGRMPVTAHGDRMISIDQTQGDSGHAADIDTIAFDSTGARFATGGKDGLTKIWDGKESIVDIGERQSPVTAVRFSPDGSLLASGGEDGIVFLFRSSTGPAGELVKKDLRQGEAWSVKFTPDSKQFATGTRGSMVVTIWDANTGEARLNVNTGSYWTGSIDFSADGKYMVSDGILDAKGKLWRLANPPRRIGEMPHNGVVGPVAFSPDEKHVLSMGHDGVLKFWKWQREPDRLDPRPVLQLVLKDWSPGINGHAYLKDRPQMITQTWKTGLLTLWDLTSGKAITEWLTGHGVANTISMRPDGKHFITAADNRSVQIWDTATHKGVLLTERAGCARYSPDGKRFATGGADGTVRLWDADTHVLQAAIPGHELMIMSLDFSKDGKKLASSSADGTVQVYTLDPSELMRLAQAKAFGDLRPDEYNMPAFLRAKPQ